MEHVNGWCFRGIYKGGLWENDLHVSALLLNYIYTHSGPLRKARAKHCLAHVIFYEF